MTHVLKPVWDEMHKNGYDAFSGTMLFNSIFHNCLHILKDKRVLDIGCGSGDAFQWMKDVVYSYEGIDISEEVCKKANKRFKEYNATKYGGAYKCDGEGNIPLINEEVDVVFSALVFQHIQKTYLEKYFQEANRVLIPGGRFLFHTTEWSHQYQGKNDLLDPLEKDHCLSGQYSHDFEVVRKLLDVTGFKMLSSVKNQNEPGLVKENAYWWVFLAEKK
jgi:cyclopropane fatty-acyl-phospholipid synthase-like methyltransferase